MNKHLIRLAMAVSLGATGGLVDRAVGAETSTGSLVHIETIGWKGLAAQNDAIVLRDLSNLPSSLALRNVALDKLAGTPARILKHLLPAGVSDQAALIRPLVDDLWMEPALVHVDGSTDRPSVLFAAKVNAARAAVWSTNLWQVAQAWQLGQPETVSAPDTKGWRITRPKSQGALAVHYRHGWVVCVGGLNTEALLEKVTTQFLARPEAGRLPDHGLLIAEIDWPRVKDWTPIVAAYPLLPMALEMRGDGEYVRTQGKFVAAEPLRIQFEDWKIPTNFVSEPLISFTAARGARRILENIPFIRQLELPEVPNQFMEWGQRFMSGQTMLALPVNAAEKAMIQVAHNMPKAIADRMNDILSGNIIWKSNQFELTWGGLPIILPFIKAVRTNDVEYLMAGLFPYVLETNLPPPELYRQLREETGVVYYDWEITEHRLLHNRHHYQLVDIFSERNTIPTDSPAFTWMSDIHTRLGNTITEVRLAAPDRLDLTRKSHLGLTGYEIVTLARWIHSKGFPLTFEPQPPVVIPDRIKSMQKKGQTSSNGSP